MNSHPDLCIPATSMSWGQPVDSHELAADRAGEMAVVLAPTAAQTSSSLRVDPPLQTEPGQLRHRLLQMIINNEQQRKTPQG